MRAKESGLTVTNAWEDWSWIWSVVFLGSLLLPIGMLAGEQQLTPEEWRMVTFLAAGVVIVHVLGFWELPRRGTHLRMHPTLALFYVLGLAGMTAGLLTIHPAFSFILSGLFSQLFYSLEARVAIPLAIGGTVMLGILTLENRSFPALLLESAFWLWVLGGICGSLISFWLNAIINQSAQRKELIDELHQTQQSLARAEREAGVLQERQRLSREIHDTLAQGLISIITHLEAADQLLEQSDFSASDSTGGDRLRHHMAQAQGTARTNLGEARRVVHDLRPELLDNASLPDAVSRVVSAWGESSDIRAGSYITGSVRPLPPEAEATLLRIVQEALANVAKHANATLVNVTLSYMPDRIILDVQDDGDGLQNGSADPLFSTGFGLHSMRERVSALGGSLLIESEPEEGATLFVEIPH